MVRRSLDLLVFLGLVAVCYTSARADVPALSVKCRGKALPSTIRVWAIPNTLYVPGPPASGFLIQLLDGITNITGIPYTVSPHRELTFGNQNPNGTFDGSLVGALVKNQADLVGTDLTITKARQTVVDFLLPFSVYQLQVLINTQFSLSGEAQYIAQNNADLAFLKNSNDSKIKEIYDSINKGRPGSIVADNDDDGAVAKVASGNFAYVGESNLVASARADSIAKNVMVMPGSSLGTFYLALAVQKESPLKPKLDLAMLQLIESGALQTMLNDANLS